MIDERRRRLVLAGLAAATVPIGAVADSYPSRPIKLVVPWPAGGVVDVRSRLVAQRLSEALGQQVVVENRPGASATLGAQAVARAAPDGYTLLVGTYLDQAAVLALMRELAYDPERDFVAVAPLGRSCTVLLIPRDLNVESAKELVALIRSKPGQLTYASGGMGTPSHLLMEKLKLVHKLDISPVHYKGAGPALPDLAAGHVQMMFDFAASSAPLVRSGKIKPLMTACARRIDVYPDVPSAPEAGFSELNVPSWGGIFAPAGTSKQIVERLNREINRIQILPEVTSHLAYAGAEIPIMNPQEFADFVRKDRPKWVEIIRAAGVEPQ